MRANPDPFTPELGYGEGFRQLAPEDLPAVVDALDRLGYDDAAVDPVLGGNFLRVARVVWA